MLLIIITLIGILLRLSYILKPEGMWNDEYVSWMISNTPFFEGFFDAIMKQCHMPIYYLYLKPFSYGSDTILRLSSVLPSILSIPIMYLVGKEYSKKIGVYAAAITSVLSFLIYYSQEIRFYSLLFLLSALLLLFTIRLLKNASKFNIIAFTVFSLIVVFTHVLGIIYVFFNFAFVLYKKNNIKKFLSKNKLISLFSILFIILTLLYFGLNILKQLPSSQWWGHFSYTNILFLFSDFFSPVLTNHINAPTKFFYNDSLAIWQTIPMLISIIAIIAGTKQNKGFALIAFLTVVTMSVISMCGIIVFITKYAIEILPILAILAACGIFRLKRFGVILLSLLIMFHISAFLTPFYVTKLPRDEGHKIIGDILDIRQPQKAIFTYYLPDRFSRYMKFKNLETYSIDKSNRQNYVKNPLKILQNINTGDTFSVIFLDSVSFVPEEYINNEKIPEMFLTFSHIKNVLLKEISSNYKVISIDRFGSWTVVTAKKL